MKSMEINFLNQSNEASWLNYKQFLKPLLKRTCEVLNQHDNFSVSVVLVDDASIQEYNNNYRNIDRPTDVLSFPDGSEEDGLVVLGDIIMSVDAIRRQADDYGHSLKREFSFLAVHGFLHLFGFDHQTKEEEKEMIDYQKEILDGLADRSS